MRSLKSKTIESFAKQILQQSQALVIKGKGCCDDGNQQPPPEDPPKSAIATTNIVVLGG